MGDDHPSRAGRSIAHREGLPSVAGRLEGRDHLVGPPALDLFFGEDRRKLYESGLDRVIDG